ncbi:hypothetical protein CI610_02561 [invertebrate metagenome]|uniref:CCHC-type domain-containing protein n=1 Tax=invertebrate metagenome TaxID=1711999 RepID=A0A2H9T5K6_9ZZZZ
MKMADGTPRIDLMDSEKRFGERSDQSYHSTPKQPMSKGSSHYRDSGFMSMHAADKTRAEKRDLSVLYSSMMDNHEDLSSPDEIDKEIEQMQEQLRRLDIENQSLRETSSRHGLKDSSTYKGNHCVRSKTESSPKVRFSDSTYSPHFNERNKEDNITCRDSNQRRSARLKEKEHISSYDSARVKRMNPRTMLDMDDSDYEDQSPVRKHKTKFVSVKASTYDGTTPWRDYLSHFEACARINRWTEQEMGLYLAVSLRGQAQGILGDLPARKQEHYFSLITALEQRFAPPNQTELYRVQLLERRQRANETLPELGQAIRRLVNLTYPTVEVGVRETLAKQQFLESLADSDMRIRIKQARPDNLTDAIHLAVELEAYKKAEKHGNEGRSYLRTASTESTESTHSAESEKSAMESMLSSIQQKLEKMQTDISQLQAVRKKQNRPAQQGQDAQNSTDRRCYKCQEIGHLRRDCPQLKKESKTASTGVANPVRTRTRKRSCKPSAGIGISSAAQEAGLYINAEVQHTKVKLLVDTGATVTILSQESYEKIPEERRPKLKEVKKDIMAANGSELKVLGQGGFMIKPEGCRDVYFEAVVAKISTEGILGLDFLKSRNGLIDLKRGSLVLDDVPVDTKYEGTLGCFRVVASEKITIPGKSEMVIAGELRSPSGEQMKSESLLIEGADSFLKNDKALVARSLVC